MTGPATGAAPALRYDAWFDSPWGRYAWRIETSAVLAALGPLPRRRIADIGCGTGRLLRILTSRGASAVGVDTDPAMLTLAATRGTVARADAHRLPLADGSMDATVTVTTLEFTADPAQVLAEMARVTRPGGRLVAAVLNPASPWGVLDRPARRAVSFYLGAKLGLVTILVTALAAGLPIPFQPVQIVLLELFMDLGASVAFVAEPESPGAMRRPPRPPGTGFLDASVLAAIITTAAALTIAVLPGYLLLGHSTATIGQARAAAVLAWLAAHALIAWTLRTQPGLPWRANPAFPAWALTALAAGLTLTLTSAGQLIGLQPLPLSWLPASPGSSSSQPSPPWPPPVHRCWRGGYRTGSRCRGDVQNAPLAVMP
jgi:SAM-dependent methyltransferase